jgi:predicted alpha/beta-hydrolase family hydrolase
MPPRTESDDLLVDGPATARVTLVLAHGAGAPMDSPFMAAVAHGVAEHGVRVARFEFPYMRARRESGARRPPDREPTLLARWREVIAALGGGAKVVIGGKSLGGRIASMVADDAAVRGLVCLGYPFHAPGKPPGNRIAHLATLRTPALILQGTRDSFGLPAEVGAYELSPAISVEWLEDGDHSFKPRARSGRTEQQNLAVAIDAVVRFIGSLERVGETHLDGLGTAYR